VARKIQPVFIVGTARCGSTKLSNMLRDHAAILSASEFLVSVTDPGGRIPQAFPEGRLMDVRQIWEVLAGLHPRQTVMLRHGIEMDEIPYPLAPTPLFSPQSGVPAILLTTLPHLTADHDALFEELRDGAVAPLAHDVNKSRLRKTLCQPGHSPQRPTGAPSAHSKKILHNLCLSSRLIGGSVRHGDGLPFLGHHPAAPIPRKNEGTCTETSIEKPAMQRRLSESRLYRELGKRISTLPG